MSEHRMNAKVVRALRAIPGCYAIKLAGGRYLQRGTPDVLAVLNGRAFLLEGKSADGDVTPLQHAEMLRWRTAGAVSCVYRSVEEAVAIVKGATA